MINKIKDECTGCHACYSRCPVGAISMVPDSEGFLHPVIDMEICTLCEVCENICPALTRERKLDTRKPQVFAAWSRDEELRLNSTSGGVFSELAKQILENNGHVVGARYKQDHTVEHYCINNVEDLPLLRQSKYLQSEMGHTYLEIESLLKAGDSVLFCGTPCQAAGLLHYLDRGYENLTVCDFICRGVASPMVYKMYLVDLEKEFGAPIETIQFKNKNIGWNQFCTFIRFTNGLTYQKDRNQDAYMYGYLRSNFYLRPCCFECKFKDIQRVSDITLGDFWGIGNTRPHLDQNKGTSVVFINTKKGGELFCTAQNRLVYEECTYEEALAGNFHILNSAKKPQHRKLFFRELEQKGSFIDVIKKHKDKRNYASVVRKLVTIIRNVFGRCKAALNTL